MDMHLPASTEWLLLAADEGLTALSVPFLRFYVFVLAGFVGYQVITKVPALLHTPLMSATNAISGISLVGSLVAAGGALRHVQHVAGLHRRDRRHDQRRRRVHDHRPHAQDVQTAGTEVSP